MISGPLDERVRDRIVAETRGNPLALLELPRGVARSGAGGRVRVAGVPGLPVLPGRIEDSFRRRLEVLPAATRRLMLVAAAEPAGEPALVWRAAERLGIGAEAVAPAADAGLLVDRAAGDVSSSAGAVGGVPGRVAGGAAGGAPGAGRRDRSARLTLIAVPGTGRRRRWGLMRRSPASWSGRRAGPRRAAGWPRRLPSWSGRPR